MQSSPLLRSFLILAAVMALLVGYFWAHKPFTPELALSLGGLALDIFTVSALVILTAGIGRRVVRGVGGDLTQFERLALESMIGLGVYAWAALILGLAGGYNGLALWGGLIILAALSGWGALDWLRDLVRTLRRAVAPPDAWTRLLAAAAWITLLTAALFAFAPPVGWDSLAYHLVAPQRYLAEGRIAAHPDNFYLGLSQGVEVLYGVTMALFGRDTAAAPLHLWYGLVAMLATAGLVRRFAEVSAGWMAVILPLTSLSVWLLLGYAYVDLAVMAYAAGLLVALVAWQESHNSRWLAIAGLCIGLAMGVKYTAGIIGVGAVVFFWFVPLPEGLRDGFVQRSSSPRRAGQNMLLMAAIALLAFLPWAMKGLLLYDNPVYPFAFGGLSWDSDRARFFNPANTGLIAEGKAWQILVIPLAAMIFGVDGSNSYAFTSGAWLLTAPLLLLFTWGYLDEAQRRLAKGCLVFAAPILLYWMAMAAVYDIGRQTRLVTGLFPPLIVLGALGFYGLARMPKKPLDIDFVVRALFVLLLVFGLVDILRQTEGSRALDYFLLSSVNRDAYLRNNGRVAQTYNAFQALEAMQQRGELPDDLQVRLMWEVKGYLCPKSMTCIADVLLDHWRHALARGAAPDDVFARWRAEGDEYLLVWHDGFEFLQRELPEQHPGYDRFLPALERWMTPVWTDGTSYTLYGWR